MKRLITLALFVANLTLYAQYQFNVTSSTYQPLSSPISLDNGNTWDQTSSFPIILGFNYGVSDQTYNAVNVMAGGGLIFPGLGFKTLRVMSHTDSGYLLADRNIANSPSTIDYEIIGSAGSRVLKIQWTNAGYREFCTSSIPNDSINFQIWLFENSTRIEVHFGSSYTTNGSYGQPDCNSGVYGTQFMFWHDTCSNVLSLIGPAALPSYGFHDHCFWAPSYAVTGTPPSGTVYNIFNLASINNETSESFNIFPNPTFDEILISGFREDFQIDYIYLTDIAGRIAVSNLGFNKTDGSIKISISELMEGCYIIVVRGKDNTFFTKRVFKKNK